MLRPSKFVRVLGLPLICLAMFAVAGGHWALLQTAAWGQMLWRYSQQEGSVVEGAQKTFSGEAPCSMCKKIAEARKQEEKAPGTSKVHKKADSMLVVFAIRVPLPTPRAVQFHATPEVFFTQSEAPPTPVPIVWG